MRGEDGRKGRGAGKSFNTQDIQRDQPRSRRRLENREETRIRRVGAASKACQDHSSHNARIVGTLAEVLIRRIIGESSELILHRLRQGRIGDNRVLCLFISEISVKVGNIENRFLVHMMVR
jgi:hypothetical protein